MGSRGSEKIRFTPEASLGGMSGAIFRPEIGGVVGYVYAAFLRRLSMRGAAGSKTLLFIAALSGIFTSILVTSACGGAPTARLQRQNRGTGGVTADKDPPGARGARRLPTTSPPPSIPGAISCPTFPTGGSHRFLTCQYQGPAGAQMTFYVYVPNGYQPTHTYPVVLILHGVDETADPSQSAAANKDNLVEQDYVSVWGPGYPAGGPSVQGRWPSFVVVPQAVGSNRWVNVPGGVASYQLTPQPTESLRMAINITQLMVRSYASVNPERLYITGISMGAYGVWDAILRWPSLFAAAVPVSGAGDPALASRVAELPIWDFHGGADDLVPVAGSQLMIHAIQSAGGHPCYTQYPDQLHVIWNLVYGISGDPTNPLYPWLFSQAKNSNGTLPSSC
jgi:dienelactone hydrolase